MALVYFDASALVKLCVAEPGSELASALWNRADVVATSRLSDTEVRATLAAGERAGSSTPTSASRRSQPGSSCGPPSIWSRSPRPSWTARAPWRG
ncbi:type II toxin-antitoxin system VapC family toxin [Oerskovia sp. M15]